MEGNGQDRTIPGQIVDTWLKGLESSELFSDTVLERLRAVARAGHLKRPAAVMEALSADQDGADATD
jgi:hypothetical protein